MNPGGSTEVSLLTEKCAYGGLWLPMLREIVLHQAQLISKDIFHLEGCAKLRSGVLERIVFPSDQNPIELDRLRELVGDVKASC